MRLIDADALVIPKYEECNNPFIEGFHQGKVDAIVEVKSLMPTVDAVEVVRCKDCRYKSEWIKNGYGEYFCRRSGLWNLTDNCYCHCGTKMDGETK